MPGLPHELPGESSPVWIVEEMKRLSGNQHNLADAVNALALKVVEATLTQTNRITELIAALQKDVEKELKDAVLHVEVEVGTRVDKVETNMEENAKAISEVKVDLATIKVRVAMWCAVGGVIVGVASSVITAMIIKVIVHQ